MAGSLDFETTPSYSLTLTATHSGSLTDTTVVVISVRDVNESPSFVGAPYSSIVPENDAAASVVTVAATDQDLGKFNDENSCVRSHSVARQKNVQGLEITFGIGLWCC